MPSSSPPPPPAAGGWTWEHDKAFENAIASYGELDWEAIAAAVPEKTADEVRRHYGILVEDVDAIEAGRVPIPQYAPDGGLGPPGPARGLSKSEHERRKGTPWSEDEHRFVFCFIKSASMWTIPNRSMMLFCLCLIKSQSASILGSEM